MTEPTVDLFEGVLMLKVLDEDVLFSFGGVSWFAGLSFKTRMKLETLSLCHPRLSV